MIGFFLYRRIAYQKTNFNQMRQMKYRSFVKLGTVSTNRILSLFYFNNFNVMLAFFIKNIHEAFKLYPCYPQKMEDNFTHNAVRLSINGKKKLAASLKLDYVFSVPKRLANLIFIKFLI